jgi:hypothetical protein
MMDKFQRDLTTEERRVVRKWALGMLLIYSACALTIFGFVSLMQDSASKSKEPPATALTATADGNQHTR